MSHFLLFLVKTSHHATQRMAGCGDACGVVRGDQRPTSTFSQMALGPAETSCSERGSLERCPHCRRFEGRYSPKRATGHRTRRCTESCVTVANSNCSVWAQRAAQEPPISNQIQECEEFIARAEKRLVLHDHHSSKLVSDLEDGRNRLQHLRAVAEATLQMPSPVPQAPPDWGAQIRSLQQMVNQLQEERDALMCATGQSPPKKPRSREEPVFATDTEVQWMQDPTDAKTLWMRERQAELAEATVQGSASRGVPIDSRDGGSDQSLVSEADVATFYGGERRFCVRIWDRIVQHQCGFLGCRVGEASNPAITRHGRRLERPTQIDVSSDEEFLVRPNWGRNVVARRCVDNETPPCRPCQQHIQPAFIPRCLQPEMSSVHVLRQPKSLTCGVVHHSLVVACDRHTISRVLYCGQASLHSLKALSVNAMIPSDRTPHRWCVQVIVAQSEIAPLFESDHVRIFRAWFDRVLQPTNQPTNVPTNHQPTNQPPTNQPTNQPTKQTNKQPNN